MTGITYDTGALIAAERNTPEMWAFHRRALERGGSPTVPAAVLAQAWRGGPQPLLARLLRACDIEPLTEADARLAGAACGLARTADVVDASVAVGALVRDDVIVTSDPADLRHLGDSLGGTLKLHTL
jgi:predicted nucleic acid-binding protein